MAGSFVQCPVCQTPVTSTAGGTCPVCGASIANLVELQPTDERETIHATAEFHRALMRSTPRVVVTPAIVGINVVIFVVMLLNGVDIMRPTVQSVLDWGANYGPKTLSGEEWRVVTCMFLHFGILHLAFNMWILWDLGHLVERLVGNAGFLLLYFVSGVAASIASLAWHPVAVSAGASGAVFGVVGALLGFMTFRRDTIPTVVLKRLRGSLVAFLIFNAFFGFAVEGIDMAAHIGGLVAGFGCGLMMSRPLSETTQGRWIRNLGVSAVAAAALPIAFLALPDAPADIQFEMRQFAKMEQEVLDTNNALVARATRGEFNDREMADRLEKDVLAPWSESRKRMEGLVEQPNANQEFMVQLVEYMQLREEAWMLQIAGLREQDAAKLQKARESMQAAEERARNMTSR